MDVVPRAILEGVEDLVDEPHGEDVVPLWVVTDLQGVFVLELG